jgi:hypothetical protein
MAEMMREAELDDLRRKLDEAGRVDLDRTVKDTIDPTGTLREEFDPSDFADRLRRSVEEPPGQGSATAPSAGAPGQPTAADLPVAAEPRRPAPPGSASGGE